MSRNVNRREAIASCVAAAGGMCLSIAVDARPGASAPAIQHRFVTVEGRSIFYREAGPIDAPTIVLWHGFPSSSFMFRTLMPLLATQYRVIAPDYPGFGYSDAPHPNEFDYTFENIAALMTKCLDALGIERYAMYVQDYGAPIGFRVALRQPMRVTALIVQNGNAYEEGFSSAWEPLQEYWRDPSPARRETVRAWLSADGIRLQYLAGVPERYHSMFAPDAWTLDWALLQRPGLLDAQLDLFGDYRHNVALYPNIQAMFRARRFPTLITWGRYDPFFTEAGALAYKRDLPQARVHFLETGHFALETHYAEIAARMLAFLRDALPTARSSGS